jgi:O-antigen ligase
LLGYGFGAFWIQPGTMQKVQTFVGWGYPVRFSDNGYLDILLGLGCVGLVLLLAILATGFWRAICVAFQARNLTSFFPLFVLIHILFINISLSYFFEQETFIWFLLIVVLFMSSPSRDRSNPAV